MADGDLDPLTRVAIRRGTDKWGPHAYTPIYHGHFGHLRDQPIRLLEIGIGGYESPQFGGLSLYMWADYFSRGQIVGIDIAEKKIAPHPRVITYRGSQDDPVFLRQIIAAHGPFDIIVDDGSHRPKHVVASFEVLFPSLSTGGFYAIEDVQTAFARLYGGSAEDGAETIQLANQLLRKALGPAVPANGAPTAITNLHAYSNLLIIQRVGEQKQMELRYDLAEPSIASAIAAMERELAHNPAPDGLAHLAYNLGRGRDFVKGLATLRRGLARWPDHFYLLWIGVWLSRRAGDRALDAECSARLLALAPDDPMVHRLLGKRRMPAGKSDAS